MRDDSRQPWEGTPEEDAAFELALARSLARAEADPPEFVPPLEFALPEALTCSMRKVNDALALSRSALRMAFNFL